ncbi:MAG: phospho-sugar mutase [Luteibaculaceae bacterium]
MQISKETVRENAKKWLTSAYDAETRNQVEELLNNADREEELIDAFYTDLDFGTGGLRGIMGVGTNRMNKYTLGAATQGLANYILKQDVKNPSVVISYDCRHNSALFGKITAEVLSANGIKAYLFNQMQPTPLLSFAVRDLGCTAGIMITASHNPPKYNGYKVYWSDGGQLVPPQDNGVITEVRAVGSAENIKFTPNQELIEFVDAQVSQNYLDAITGISFRGQEQNAKSSLKIVFTSIHGVTYAKGPAALRRFGFNNLFFVEPQMEPNGDFPTVKSPNPEEPEALSMAEEVAKTHQADVLMGTDPDGDRVGIAVRELDGTYRYFNGNETAAIVYYYMLSMLKEKGELTPKHYVVKTIVTSKLLSQIADGFNIPCYDTLTGFKWIADVIRRKEGKEIYVIGAEESYGMMPGTVLRDKDGISGCCLIAETLAWAKEKGLTASQLLDEIHLKFGFFKEHLISIYKEGASGAQKISEMMEQYRKNTPLVLGGIKVAQLFDYKTLECKNLKDNTTSKIDLPSSNVIQFVLEDGSVVTARPSGTEPKIKFYFSVSGNANMPNRYALAQDKINALAQDLLN